MPTIDRSTVSGTFSERGQAEQAVAELRQAGFSDALVGLAGSDEVLEKINTNVFAQAAETTSVVVTVKAEERWQEAFAILQKNGASNMTPTTTEATVEQSSSPTANQTTDDTSVEPHLEYDPIMGPQVTTQNAAPVASGGFGLERDPALDSDIPTSDPNLQKNRVPEKEGEDTFFGQPVIPQHVEPGSPADPNVRKPRVP